MRISDWSSDVCSSDLSRLRGCFTNRGWRNKCHSYPARLAAGAGKRKLGLHHRFKLIIVIFLLGLGSRLICDDRSSRRLRLTRIWLEARWIEYKRRLGRSEEHTSELQSLMRSSYAVFCVKKNKRP